MFGRRKTAKPNRDAIVDTSIPDRYVQSLINDPASFRLFEVVTEEELGRLAYASLHIVPEDRDIRAGVMLRSALQLIDACLHFSCTPDELYSLMGVDLSRDAVEPVELLVWRVLTDSCGEFDFEPEALLSLATVSGHDGVTLRQMILYSVGGIRLGRHRGSL